MIASIRFLAWVAMFNFLCVGAALAQGCQGLDMRKFADAIGMEPTLRSQFSLEIASCEHIQVASDYVGFILKEDNPKVHSGVRSELAIGFPFEEGDTVEYRWSVYLPATGTPGGDSTQWWLLAQWHDQPDPRLGETWATFKAQPPPVAIHVENRQGVVGLGLSGLLGSKLSWTPAPLATWLDIRVTIKWSTGNDGVVSFAVDGRPEFKYLSRGKNMLNHYHHYFKVGQYRAPTVNWATTVFVKNIRMKER